MQRLTGALVGWKRTPSKYGIVLTLQVVDGVEQYKRAEYDKVEVALNDRQLRSLARDLSRAAGERGIPLDSKRPWWRLRRLWPQ